MLRDALSLASSHAPSWANEAGVVARFASRSRWAALLLLCGLPLLLFSPNALSQSPHNVRAWGSNDYGQLGNGGPPNGVGIAGGTSHSLALKDDGTVWAWGYNGWGQLGNGSTDNSSTPVQVIDPSSSDGYLSGVVAIAAGNNYSLALKADGTVRAWGYNGSGVLGNGSNTPSYTHTPVQVIDPSSSDGYLSGVVAIAGGDQHSLALKADGTVWAWGSDYYGQLGSSQSGLFFPVQSDITDVVGIAAGDLHSLALKADGTVWAWGYNSDGQLGNGLQIRALVPVQVSGLSGVVDIAGGYFHSLALKADGTVWAWGNNGSGQLGNGSTVNNLVPVRSDITGVMAIVAGNSHSVALKADGTVWAWGRGAEGQLGDGTTTQRSVPVQSQFTGVAGIGAIAAGWYHSLAIENRPPVATDDTYSTDEDIALSISAPGVLANDTDVDGDTLTVTAFTPPANGTVTVGADGSLSYAPAQDMNGPDSFTYTVSDEYGGSDTATVTIDVRPVNDPPVASAQSVTTDEDTKAPIVLAGTDVDGDTLTYSVVDNPTHGTFENGEYTPDANWNGQDSFTYKANDGTVDSDAATVTITVNAVNDPPVAVDDAADTNEDTPVTVPVLANDTDVDGDTLTVTAFTPPANGTVTVGADGSLSYAPAQDTNGPDTFTYTVSDEYGGSDTATVTIDVRPVNDPPVAVDDAAAAISGVPTSISVLVNDYDPDGDPLTVMLVTVPANGTAAISADGKTVVYTSFKKFQGTDSFTYTVSDSTAYSQSATVQVKVSRSNRRPR